MSMTLMCMQSQKDGYRSRASYKLLEIVGKDPSDPPRDDCGRPGCQHRAAGPRWRPWTWWATRVRVHALDLFCPWIGIAGVDFILGDFTEEEVLAGAVVTVIG